jgi:cell division protein FtsB
MDATMDQLYAEMRKMNETQTAQGQMLAVQSSVLNQIVARLDQSNQATAAQGAQIATLVTEVTVMKNETAAWRSELNGINAWRADTLNQFIPRREVEALRHEERIKDLEDSRDATGERQFSFLQWLTSNGLTTLFFLIMLIITIYSTFYK